MQAGIFRQKGCRVHHAVYVTFLFGVALVLVGTVGEISGFRAIVCAKNENDLVRRVILLVGIYGAMSLLLALFLVHLWG
jgi:hypothetical protein